MDRKISNSWKVLGQGILTSFADLILSILMWNVFTIKFQILLISTPFRLLIERINRQKRAAELEDETALKLPASLPEELLSGRAVSVGEHTTEKLQEYRQPRQDRNAKTD
jgi:hypothetical protein